MSSNAGDDELSLTLLESVRCLECGSIYAKPAGGGTARQNPGCPHCGYVGWMGTGGGVTPGLQWRHFAADQRLRRGGRQG